VNRSQAEVTRVTGPLAEDVSAAPSAVLRLAPWAVLGALPLVAVALAVRPIEDPDAFWHVRAGQFLAQTWQFVGPDPWGRFTTHPWVLHEWLPELAMAGGYAVAGFAGVAWLWTLGVAGVVAAVFGACRHQAGLLIALLATLAGVLGAGMSLQPRPQLVTFALLPLATAAWMATARDRRPRWWLVPVTWVWACSHGMWVTGPLLGLAVLVGMALDRTPRQALRAPALVLLGTIVAGAVTPVGPALLLAPLSVSGYAKYVSEWDPPSLASPPVAITLGMLGVVVAIWARRRTPVSWSRIAVWATALGWTLLYTRTVAVGAVIAAPLLAETLARVAPDSLMEASSRGKERMALAVSTAACLVLAAFAVPVLAQRPANVPTGLDRTLAAVPAGSVVFNEYSLGGWLLLTHPSLAPVIDPRTELYAVSYVDDYVEARAARPGWREVVDRDGATYALLPVDSPLADALEHERGWVDLGHDAGYRLLRSPTSS
jgi:hypothetical protein